MKKIMTNEYSDRLQHWIRVLKQDFYRPLQEISFSGFTTYDSLSLSEAIAHSFVPLASETMWGHSWEYMWLKADIVLPNEAAGNIIVLDLGFQGEATIFVNGKEFGTKRAEWVDVPHHYMVDNWLTLTGEAGQSYSVVCEVYAGHFFPNEGSEAVGPVIPGSFKNPLEEGKRRKIGFSSFGIWNEDAYQLYMDVSTLFYLFNQLPDNDLRTSQIADALERFTHIVDFEQDPDSRKETYRKAREALKPVLASRNGDCQATLYAIGNSHLDLAWLWPFGETRRKTARTFAQQLRLMEKYPEYRYIQSQPASYEMCREYYPGLYQRIKSAVQKGQWIADGGMYVEPDTNMSSGEALIRQLLYGKRFYHDEFGVDSQVLWLPDTFGYTAALPQILLGCGVKYLVTQKIFWSYNDSDRFPYHYFTWEGMDGSKVTSFLPTNYTYRTDPEELCKAWESRVQKRSLNSFLIPFGYGDGGGGPTRDHIEYVLREKNLQGMPKVEFCTPIGFFKKMEENGNPVNTWNGELYFSAHRGTYTSQAKVKKNNRIGEIMLRDLELWSSINIAVNNSAPQYEEVNHLWKLLLLNQFHDILPGSGIGRVYEEANKLHEELQKKASALIQNAIDSLASGKEGLTCFNSLSWERTVLVPVGNEFFSGAETTEGTPIPIMNGLALVTIPAMGHVSFLPSTCSASSHICTATETDTGFILKNEIVRVIIGQNGHMISWRDMRNGLEFSGSEMNQLVLYKDVPRKYDAWDIDSMYREDEIPLENPVSISVLKAEGLEASLLVHYRIMNSDLSQIISIRSGSEQVYFSNTVDWHEHHKLLKVRFNCCVHARNAIHEMQFGYVERPTHRSSTYDQTRYEVCNHHYTALCDNYRGFAILNDCKYGVGTEEGTIELTLLRGALCPDTNADQGIHNFTYAFTAWQGAFADSSVICEGYELNQPIRICNGSASSFSAFETNEKNIIIETVKPAEDKTGNIILRIYEAAGRTVTSHIKVHLRSYTKFALCNMLEEPLNEYIPISDGVIPLDFTPFKVYTIRLKA